MIGGPTWPAPRAFHPPCLAKAVSSSAERDEIKRLRAELKRVEQERDSLKKSRDKRLLHAQALPTASVMSRYQFIEQVAATEPGRALNARLGRRHYLSASGRRALVLFGHLARYLLPARSGLTVRYAHAQ